jgi:thioredoxin reductase (NADPH)
MSTPERHDLVVIGAGPAGLNAALTAQSERIKTMVVDGGVRVGGQAATSSKIENYAGFPDGISGHDLTALMVKQALKFNTTFMGPSRVTDVLPVEEGMLVCTDEGEKYLGQVALLTTGVEYKSLKARNMSAYTGLGVNYGPAPIAADYSDKKVIVIGGANSAGQAAVNFSAFQACEVDLIIRAASIEEKMSGYLIDQIAERENINVQTSTEVIGVDGNGTLNKATLYNNGTKEARDVDVDEIFVFIGSIPKTLWLPDAVLRDEKGFVMSGVDLPAEQREEFMKQTGGRPPFGHETSMPGLFVAGDVRSGIPKRVNIATGDGANAVVEIHSYRQLLLESSQK